MAENLNENISKEIKTESQHEEQTIKEEQPLTIVREYVQTEVIQTVVNNELPLDDLKKLYATSSNIVNVATSQQNETSTSGEDSSEQEDSGYQRLLIVEDPNLNENGDNDIGDPLTPSHSPKSINIGEQYQAIVPDILSSYDSDAQESIEDQVLWKPPLDENDDENIALVNRFLKFAAKEHRTADQETILQVFLSTNYNTDQALDKLRLPTTPKNYFCSAAWTPAECDQFEQCFKEHLKKFSMFTIPNRTVHELVFFYYIWKKTARHDVFVRQNRVEKRRFHLHPYVTDYLEKFFIEQEQQMTNAFEQNHSSLTALNPQITGDSLMSKRRLSSDLFLKPMSTVKKVKPLTNTNENEQIYSNESPQTTPIASPMMTRTLNEDIK